MSGHEQIGQAPGAAAAGSLGSYLVGRGLVKQAQLEETKQSRSVYGGRLGTNLVELGYLGLEELATHLAAYHGLSMPPNDWLEAPDPKALKLVPMALVRKLKILPLHLEREAIHVAMVDPRDPEQLEFVVTAANRPVVSYVLPEIRLLYWLEMHLQIDRHPRYVNLAARLRRTDMRVPEDGTPCTPPAEAGVLAPLPVGAAQTSAQTSGRDKAQAPELLEQWFNESEPVGEEPQFAFGDASPGGSSEEASVAMPSEEPHEALEEELLLDDLFEEDEADAAGSPRAIEPVVDQVLLRPSQVAELEATMDGAAGRDDIVDLVLRLALSHCEAAVLFLVRGDRVQAFRAGGAGVVTSALDEIELPLHVHSVFAHPAVTGFPFRGAPPEGGIDERMLTSLGRDEIQELLVQPISIGGRVVNLLYCDNGNSPFGETSIAALGALADRAAVAYERLILERKRAAPV